jgi:hypothetical protein
MLAAFNRLYLEVNEDVEIRNSLLPPGAGHRFNPPTASSDGNRFTVAVSGKIALNRPITFRLRESDIAVLNGDDKPMFTATVTISDDGECRLRVGGQELEFWQVRRRALEHLFFEIIPE